MIAVAVAMRVLLAPPMLMIVLCLLLSAMLSLLLLLLLLLVPLLTMDGVMATVAVVGGGSSGSGEQNLHLFPNSFGSGGALGRPHHNPFAVGWLVIVVSSWLAVGACK